MENIFLEQEYSSLIASSGMNKDDSLYDIYEILDLVDDLIRWKMKFKYKFHNILILSSTDQTMHMNGYCLIESFVCSSKVFVTIRLNNLN